MSTEPGQPAWIEQPPPAGSFRSIFKWGDPGAFKHPNDRLYHVLKQNFDLTDADFHEPRKAGLEPVPDSLPGALSGSQVSAFVSLLGPDNVRTDGYARLKAGSGKSMFDLFRLREQKLPALPGAVLYPRNADDVRAIVRLCAKKKVPVYIFGAGSSVTRGVECTRGGVSLDLSRHMHRVLAFSAVNQTVTVEPGKLGPDLEDCLNQASEIFGAPHDYTVGHFPQSFEFSTVGGWVVTRGAGQNSTYYGKIEDMVLSQTYVTPTGDIVTKPYPRKATGPDIDQIMIGSEGAFGILVAVTLKLKRYQPNHTRRFSFLFHDWASGCAAMRETMQGEFGFPSVFRLSDPEETDLALKLYGVEGTPIDLLLKLRGFRPGKRCLLIGSCDGDADFTRLVLRKTKRICRRHGGASATGFVTRKWEHGRFRDPYMREDLMDFGVVIDTLECAVNWEQLDHVHQTVRAYCHERPKTIVMAHMSHIYPQGANLYFIFIARMEFAEFQKFHRGLLDAIARSGAALSHHHGSGKMMGPWMKEQLGEENLALVKAIKRHFDPKNIMNPGGTLGLD